MKKYEAIIFSNRLSVQIQKPKWQEEIPTSDVIDKNDRKSLEGLLRIITGSNKANEQQEKIIVGKIKSILNDKFKSIDSLLFTLASLRAMMKDENSRDIIDELLRKIPEPKGQSQANIR